ncbi:hypothetical protein HF086_007166 [Spodoptera exigua]|uniref:Uncharacterized protein n=1 Tax=Spodoptera exigua TaxID=7107 RepID=A0A922SGH6_SPOEX|nr:hypothetical protein HF086_007166 [Spodoptera exigua]
MNIVMLPQRSGKNIICSNVSELKLLNETLHKENIAKEREIRQLNKDAQAYEQTIMNLRKEMSNCKYHTPEVSKKDAEVMAGMCCTGSECGEWEPVKDFSELLRHETLKYQERIQKMESNLKTSSENIRELRRVNVSLSEEMQAMRRLCAALDEQCRDANMRALFKDDIIKEMRRQLAGQGQGFPRQCTLQESTRICPRQETLQACPQQVSPRHCSRQEHSGYPSRRPACHKSTDSSRCCGGGAHKRGEIKFARLELCPDNKTQKTKKHGKFDCDCVEELYFNDETKKSCGSSPRSCCTERSDGARCKLTPSEFFAQLRKGLKCHSPTKMKKVS